MSQGLRSGKILIATRSEGKLRELRQFFSGAGIEVSSLEEAGIQETADEADIEQFDTFQQNAQAKARYFLQKTGTPTVADDSGLIVDALRGQPGVMSKRWSGRSDLSGQALDEANNWKLIAELESIDLQSDFSESDSHFPFPARYVCAATYVDADHEVSVVGETTGGIIRTARGKNGFGYDPYFESAAVRGTFGQAKPEVKMRVSHRGRAFRALLEALRAQGVIG